jgi:hypothetical protein
MKKRNFDGSIRVIWNDGGKLKTMGVYYPNKNQNRKFDNQGELLPWLSKYENGFEVDLESGEESRFLEWYKNIENACEEFVSSCKAHELYSNTNWDTATSHAHFLWEQSRLERKGLIEKHGEIDAYDNNTCYWFPTNPAPEILTHLEENWLFTLTKI